MPREDAAQFNGTLKTATYPNKYNAVIPAEGPFYRIGLKLTVKDATAPGGKRTLIEGLDYYLGYYFKELAEAEQDQIYGGFILLTATEVDYEILSVGRQYRLPQSEIGKYLVRTDLKDPRNVDWSELMKYAPVISPIDPPENIEEAILRDEVVKAIEDIRVGILARASDLDTAFTELTDMIYQNGNTVFEQEMYQHHLKSNAHGYTTTDVGALPVVGKAVDATRAFGRTLAELVNLMSTSGISQAHVDLLMDNTLGDLLGRLRVLNNDAITFQTTAGHLISLKGEKFIITSPKPLVLKADQDNNDTGIGVEFSAGLNTLWVHSGKAGDKWGGYSMDVLAPVFNSVFLVTPEMVGMYLTAVKLLPANAYFKSSDTLKIYGSGKQTNPVYMNVELPTATNAVAGLFSITNISNSVATGAAISQKAVTDLKAKLDLYVDDTYSINGKRFVKDASGNQVLTLTKADFGVDKMDNTTPLEKPVTKALTAALATKAKSDHTHTIADLDNVPYGSTTASGLLKIWDAIDTTDDKVVTSRQGFLLDQKIDQLSDKINTLLPAWTVPGAKFGNGGFLPIPAMGNYSGFTKNQTYQKGLIGYQQGRLYSLRNGSNGIAGSEAIYYAYADITNDQKLTNVQQTSVKYMPAGMSKFPGVSLVAILITGTDGAVCLGSDGKRYLVLFNGSMDHAKHTAVSQVNFPDYRNGNGTDVTTAEFVPNVSTDDIVAVGTNVFLLRNVLTNAQYSVAAWKLKAADVANATVMFERVILTGENGMSGDNLMIRYGQKTAASQTGPFVTYLTPEAAAKWVNATNFVHGPEANHMYGVSEGKVRVNHTPTMWFAAPNGDVLNFSQWQTSFVLDTEANTVTLECPQRFPLVADVTTVKYADGTFDGFTQGKWHGGVANNRTFATVVNDVVVSQWLAGDADQMPGIAIRPAKGKSLYDFLRYDYTAFADATQNSAATLNQGRGSVYSTGMSYPLGLGGSNLLWLSDPRTRTAIEVEVDPNKPYNVAGYSGYGPDNARRVVDSTLYEQLSNIPLMLTPSQGVGVLNGWYCTGPESFPYKNVPGNFALAADRLNLTQTEWNKMKQSILDGAPTGAANGYASEYINAANQAGKALFAVWFMGIGTAHPLTLIQVSAQRVVNNVNILDVYYFTMTPTISGGNVSFPTAAVNLLDFFNNLDYGLNYAMLGEITGGKTKRVGQPIMASTNGTDFAIWLPYTLGLRLIGDLASVGYAAGLRYSSGTWTKVAGKTALRRMAPSHTPESVVYMGAGSWNSVARIYSKADRVFCSGDAYTLANFVADPTFVTTASPQAVILAGVETAEGWILYLTEEVELSFGSASYTLPTWSIDLSDAYPTAHANRTFYLHAQVVNGTASYLMDTVRHPDTDSLLYVGWVTTDANRITGQDIQQVKRLGQVKQLEEHAGVAYRHDVSAARESRVGSMGLLKRVALSTPGLGVAGYADGQELYKGIERQLRSALPIQKRFAGFAVTKWEHFQNVARRFWLKNPTETAAVSGDNAKAASFNMKWIGAQMSPVVSGETYTAVAQLRFTVPGNVGDASKMISQRYAVPNGISSFKYCLNSAATSQSSEMTFNTGNDLVNIVGSGLAAGMEYVMHMSVQLTAAQYQSLGNKILSMQVVEDATGTVFRQTDVDTPFLIYASSELNGGGVVRVARELVIPNLPSEPAVVIHAGNDGLNPPYQASYDAGTLTLSVACEYAAGGALVDLDEIQVNLMFKS